MMGYKDIEFELVEIGSNWLQNRVKGNLIDLRNCPPNSSNTQMDEHLNNWVIYLENELTHYKQKVEELEFNLRKKNQELNKSLEFRREDEADNKVLDELRKKDDIICRQGDNINKVMLWQSEL